MRLAKICHPDHSKDDGTKFREVQQAWECLSDATKRSEYDTKIKTDGSRTLSYSKCVYRKPTLGDLSFKLELTLEEMYSGCLKTKEVQRQIVCETCDGEGATFWRDCENCQASGSMKIRTEKRGKSIITEGVQKCTSCKGNGRIIENEDLCPDCQGSPCKMETATINIRTPRELTPYATLSTSGGGHQEPGVDKKGPVYTSIEMIPHNRYKFMPGDHTFSNLIINHTISLAEAFKGFTMQFTHLNGKSYIFDSNGQNESEYRRLIRPGDLFVVPNLGFKPNGKLYIKIQNVEFPQNTFLSNEEAHAYAEPLEQHSNDQSTSSNVIENENENVEKISLQYVVVDE